MSPGVDWAAVHARLQAVSRALEHASVPSRNDRARILKERAARFAEEETVKPPVFAEVVVFTVSGESYGLESRLVSEVGALKSLTPIPCTPPFILGITSVRGRIHPVVDLQRLLQLPERGLAESDKLLVLGSGESGTALRADAVIGVRLIAADEVLTALPAGIPAKYLKAITRDRIGILDAEALISDPALIVNEEVE